MRQIGGRYDNALTRGDLTDVEIRLEKVCREKSVEAIVSKLFFREGLNLSRSKSIILALGFTAQRTELN